MKKLSSMSIKKQNKQLISSFIKEFDCSIDKTLENSLDIELEEARCSLTGRELHPGDVVLISMKSKDDIWQARAGLFKIEKIGPNPLHEVFPAMPKTRIDLCLVEQPYDGVKKCYLSHCYETHDMLVVKIDDELLAHASIASVLHHQ